MITTPMWSALQRKAAFAEAVRSRVKAGEPTNRRRSEDLRKEERHTIYGKLIHELQLFTDPHIDSELIRQLFDVDEMLYFAALITGAGSQSPYLTIHNHQLANIGSRSSTDEGNGAN